MNDPTSLQERVANPAGTGNSGRPNQDKTTGASIPERDKVGPAGPSTQSGALDSILAPRASVLQLSFKEKEALCASFLPFLDNGGLFVPTQREHKLGADMYLVVTLPDDPQRHSVAGKVAWITPANAQGKRAQGVGVHFLAEERSQLLRARIEQVVGTMLESARPTQTL